MQLLHFTLNCNLLLKATADQVADLYSEIIAKYAEL